MKGRGENEMDTPSPPHAPITSFSKHRLFQISYLQITILQPCLLVLGLMFMRVLTADHLVSWTREQPFSLQTMGGGSSLKEEKQQQQQLNWTELLYLSHASLLFVGAGIHLHTPASRDTIAEPQRRTVHATLLCVRPAIRGKKLVLPVI